MAPSTSPPRRQASPIGQASRDGIQAARGMIQGPNRVTRLPASPRETASIKCSQLRKARTRAQEAVHALQSELQVIEGLEDDQATIKDTLNMEINKLKTRLSFEKHWSSSESSKAKHTSDRLATQVKKLEQELVDAKAKTVVDDEARNELADAHLEITELEQELKQERARCSANCDAKQELDELKAKLVEMVAGAKFKESWD
ncbi:hypothetical protein ACET3X_008789 [Alternaria dauci]|uniref:Uncharacterized protein n=1 Tax=Alternaria dauci TaxID=48095 RepID=A0ABR3U7Y5_9PLEO